MGYRDNEYGKLRKVLLCRPVYFEWEPINEIAKRYLEYGKFDYHIAQEEHEELADALCSAGVEVYYVEPSKPHHYMVYTRDFGKNLDDGVFLGRFRMPVRMGEEDLIEQYLKKRGVPVIGQVLCGSLEGGDISFIDPHTLVVGIGARSSIEGVKSLGDFLKPKEIEVIPVEFEYKYLHLDLLFVVLAEKTCLVCKEGLTDRFLKLLEGKNYEMVEVVAEDAMELKNNVLSLGNGKILSFKENVVVNQKLRALGFEVLDPSLKMFTNGGGAPHCLTFPLERDTA
jgi:N-dimethylarginine dimethylaminohydrolase